MLTHHNLRTRWPRQRNRAARRSMFVLGLWIRAVGIGALGAASGIALLFEGTSSPGSAVGLLVIGVACTAVAWRRVSAILGVADRQERDVPGATLPAVSHGTTAVEARSAGNSPAASSAAY